jgi:rhodanese-related sulfurtransferase
MRSNLLTARERTKRRWLPATLLIIAAIGAATLYLFAMRAPTWADVDDWIALRYGATDFISTTELAALMADDNATPQSKKLLILDVRDAREHAISRIPGATHVAPNEIIDFAQRELVSRARAQTIVVYCAVGIRSAEAARDLEAIGFTDVRNLRGSIFQWANENRALEGDQQHVHPYDAYWGQLLDEKRRAGANAIE